MAITVLVALISLVVGFIILAQVKARLVHVSKEEYKSQQSLLANQIADALTTNLVSVENQLHIIATMPEVQNIDDVDRCNDKLQQLLTINQKQLGNLTRTNPDGKYVCSVNKTAIGRDAAKYGSNIRSLANADNKFVVGRMVQSPASDTLVIGLHVPVYVDGNFRGSMGGALHFDKFQDVYLASVKFGKNGYAALIDDNGDILYHPSKELRGKNLLSPDIIKYFEPQDQMHQLVDDIKAGKSGAFNYKITGTHKEGLYKTFKLPDVDRHWAVVVAIPMEDQETAVNQAGINTIFIVLVALFSVTTGLLTFVSFHIIRKNNEVQRMKDDFISITSHQLRTPATIVKQNLGLIKSGYVKDKKDVQRFINSAYESNEDQLSVIESILSVSKLEAGRLEITKERLALQDLITTLAEKLKMNITSKKHTLKLQMSSRPVHVRADPTKLTMAIENLISNAVKYTPSGGTITIRARNKGHKAVISVTDNGNGIAQEDLSKLFMRFNRLRSAITSHVPGTGLGLYLTKKIVELHGGTIKVESSQGKGSTFTIELPKE